MDNTLNVPAIPRLVLKVGATIASIAWVAAAEYAQALRATTKASSPRRSLSDVRAMYLPRDSLHEDG